MIRTIFALALLTSAVAAHAQISPSPSFEDPRIQTVVNRPGAPIRLVLFPDSAMQLVFHSGETVQRAVVSDGSAFRAAVVGYGDTIELNALRAGATATMRVETSLHSYEFALETGEGLAAAYLVRFVPGKDEPRPASRPEAGAPSWSYRMSGASSVKPDTIMDDGSRTFLTWHMDQAMPAVFGVGPGGNEELVAGYMREGTYVIDRIYPELIFRFNKEIAKAKRGKEHD